MAQQKRTSEQIKKQLQTERKSLYSKRSTLIKKREALISKGGTEKQRAAIEKKIDNIAVRIDSKTTKLFKYTENYKKIKDSKRREVNSFNALMRIRKDRSLSAEEKKSIDAKIREKAKKIRDFDELMGKKIIVKRGESSFKDDRKEKVRTWVEPFWAVKDIFAGIYNPNKYDTIDFEGDVYSLDSEMAYLFAVDDFIVYTEAERWKVPFKYLVSIVADEGNRKITVERA